MGEAMLSGRVTWENFLEALGERFGWVLVSLFDQREFDTFIQKSEPSASKNLNRNTGR